MKLLRLLMPLIALESAAHAKPEAFYVAAKDGIYRGQIDTETGALAPLRFQIAAPHSNFLALAQDGKTLYATLQKSVASYRVGADGALTVLNEVPSGGDGACHILLAPKGGAIFVANYSGNLAQFRVNPNGSLGENPMLVPFHGSGPNKNRQDASHAHGGFISPDGRFLYVCDLGADRIWILPLNAEGEVLGPAGPMAFGISAPGSGPRHLAFSADGKFAYVANELGRTVTSFARDSATGALTPLDTVSALATDKPAANVTSSEIFRHPNGRWLYVSNRGSDTLSVFAIRTDGKLALLQEIACGVKAPRSFALDPAGRWIIAAGERDGRLSVLKLDPATGQLASTSSSLSGLSVPDCVLFGP